MKRINLILLSFILVTLFATTVLAETAPETRAFWVVRGDNLLSMESIDRMIQDHLDLNMNAILVQVNGRAEAYYQSKVTPVVPGVSADFDPLQIIIEKAHANGLQVHAWINAYTVGPLGVKLANPNHVANLHPDWMTVDSSGISVIDYTASQAEADALPALMLEPGLPEVQDFVAAMFLEVVENYDVDGVHYDYIRYPARVFGYHPYNLERFEAEYGVNPMEIANDANRLMEELGREEYWELSRAWDQLRRDNVTTLVRRIYSEVKAVKPDVMISAAVFADLASGSATEHRFQDWPAWLEEGIIDVAVPMAYGTNPAVVAYQIQQAVQHAGEERLAFAGLGAYNISDPEQMVQMIKRVRSVNPHGIILFAHHAVRDNKEYMELLRTEAFPEKAPAY